MIHTFFTVIGCVSVIGIIAFIFEIIFQIFQNFFKKK